MLGHIISCLGQIKCILQIITIVFLVYLSAASPDDFLAGGTHILSKEVRSLARREVVPAARGDGPAGHAPRENMSAALTTIKHKVKVGG